jgi:hypothetical protein
MKRFPLISILLLAVCFAFFPKFANAQAGGNDINISVTLDRDSIGLNEQATLQVVVSGTVQNLPEPQMPTLPMFEVYSQGRSSNISITNGQISSAVTYRYILLPKKPGTYPIDQIALVYRNHRYKGNEVELTVLNKGNSAGQNLEKQAQDSNGKGKDYFMEAVVNTRTPYVNQQVTLTLKFCIAVQYYGSPELQEPATTGFWSEVLGNKAPYYQKINGRTYRVIERKYALFPTQTGELTIGRAAITATVAARGGGYKDPFNVFGNFFGRGQDITVRTSPINIKVRPLPEKGKPDNFSSTIGNFAITASADKHTVEVNQPVTVSIKIYGTGNIKSVAEPVLPDLDDFRIYKASSNENVSKNNDLIGGTKDFEEVFIPKRPGQLEIPALSFNYFDPLRSKYVTLSTQPIRLQVTKPEGYASTSDIPFSGPDQTIGSEAKDIRFIKESMGRTSNVGGIILFSPIYLILNGLPVALLAATVLVRKRKEKISSNIGYARSRSAARAARKRLAKAKSLATTEKGGAFYAEIYQTVTSFIADKLNISPHGLTTDRIKELLKEHAADEGLIEQTAQLLGQCDFARFAPSSITQESINQSLKSAEDVMVAMGGIRF